MELCELMKNIEKEGVLVPLLVRTNSYGDGYENIQVKKSVFIDAATYFLKNYGRETPTKPKDIDKSQYISTDDMEIIEKRIIESSK